MIKLDNPVWASLGTRHASLAVAADGVARYPPEVAPFAALADPALDAAQALEEIIAAGESVLFVGPVPRPAAGWEREGPVPIAQMICRATIAQPAGPEITELGDDQLADMLALTALVYPHYFRPQTPRMGRYVGIYEDGMLVAMAGERMGFDGYQEISAVCTHPGHTGRGHAQRLVAELNNASLRIGRLSFLHVSHENSRAKALYERLGYLHRADIDLWTVRRILAP